MFFRNRHKFDYITMHDVDEITVPIKHHSIVDMIKQVEKENTHVTFSSILMSQHFFLEYKEELTKKPY